jgi:hypothetical protein
MLDLGHAIAYCTLAALQGALVMLPRPVGSAAWRLRSPAWALVLPGSLIVGTFGVLAVPASPTDLAVLAAVATPLLAGLAVVRILRGARRAWLAALPLLGAGALTLPTWPAELAACVLTALGCLTVGVVLVRLTPLPWVAAGVFTMCIVDVTLLAAGVGQTAAVELERAMSHSALPEFHHAQLAGVTKDYPDLVLAGVLGGALAGSARQRTAAMLVTLLVCANGMFFMVADMLPGTVPLGVAAAVVALLERRGGAFRQRTRRRSSISHPELAPSRA